MQPPASRHPDHATRTHMRSDKCSQQVCCALNHPLPPCCTSRWAARPSNQDALLEEASALVQQWQIQCQDMRSKHEAVMTKGIGPPQAPPLAAEQEAAADADMVDAADNAP